MLPLAPGAYQSLELVGESAKQAREIADLMGMDTELTDELQPSSEANAVATWRLEVLLEQGYVKDEKQTIAQLLGGASIVRFALVAIG